ncbi:MAG: alpha/beta hydrolase [Candidatus Brocadiaceae bacterium]|nr:alpha/beta hydrolase [Candidatus Brocadiaceae bacterium]
MNTTIFKEGSESNYIRHNNISSGKTTLLFLHGLGDSGLCYQEIFDDRRFDKFNIIVPDMTGYGKSSVSTNGNYSFKTYISRLWKIVEESRINELIVIGHSMGGDIATLFCASDKKNSVKKFVNTEGNLTQFDLFISYEAVKAEENGNFKHWFYDEFMKAKVLENWGQKHPSCKRYHSSLRNCSTDAFLANAIELSQRNISLPGKYKSEIGRIYCTLSIPKIFCYGTESIHPETIDFLKENRLAYQVFDDAFHWLMIDKPKEFYTFLYEFVIE